MTIHQSGPQPGHAAHIVPAGQAALAPAVPDAAPGGPGDAAHIVPVGAGDGTVVLTAAHPPQVHQAHNAAGVVLFPGDLSRIDTGSDDGPGLIPEVQRAVALPDQVVLRVKVVLDGHGAHDPGHIDIALHRSVIPGIGQIPRICGRRGFIRHILEPVLRLFAALQQVPQQVGDHAELPVDGVQHGLPQGVSVIQQAGENVSQSVPLLPERAVDGTDGEGGFLRQLPEDIGQVLAETGGTGRQLFQRPAGGPERLRDISALGQQLRQQRCRVGGVPGGIQQRLRRRSQGLPRGRRILPG